MAFRQFDLIWARKPTGKRLWWPASILPDPKDERMAVRAVRFIGATYKKSICRLDIVPFDVKTQDVRYDDQMLDLAVQEAVSMSRAFFPKVMCRRVDQDELLSVEDVEKDVEGEEDKEEDLNLGDQVYKDIEAEDKEEDINIDGWKDDFLASLEDEDKGNDEAVITEHNQRPEKKKVLSAIRVRPSALSTKEIQQIPTKHLEAFIQEEEQLSDYEKIRQKNIAEQRAMFAELMTFKSSLTPQLPRRQSNAKPRKPFSNRRDPVVTRRRSRRYSDGSSCVTSEESTPRKRVFEEFSSDEDDDSSSSPGKRRRFVRRESWFHDPNTRILAPDDITEEMVENIANRVSEKIYDQERGTTCHQCRQKTSDTKTVCRSGHCVGIRGMFCGVCLLNRYGENVREALMDPNWMCPACLDVCNCSICRNRIGKGATGPITYLALAKGFKSVKDFLDSLKKSQ